MASFSMADVISSEASVPTTECR